MKLAKLTTDRTFGIEIEFTNGTSMNREELAKYINKKFRKLECIAEGYNHTTRDHWKIVTDSTCGLELVSPILSGQQGMKEAKCIIDCLASIEGVNVNRDCGIHVHVGADDVTAQGLKNVVMFYAKNQHMIQTVLAPSRRNSRWTHTLANRYGDTTQMENRMAGCDTVSDVISAFNGTRYQTVNLDAYGRQRTIEFRQHGGSVCSEKILNWAHWLITTFEMCNQPTTVITKKVRTNQTQAFNKCFGHTSKIVQNYMLGRSNHFGFTQYGQVKEVSIVKRWEAVCEEEAKVYTVNKLSNGGFEARVDGNAVQSVKQTLRALLGICDSGETTRQLGNLLLATNGTNLQVTA